MGVCQGRELRHSKLRQVVATNRSNGARVPSCVTSAHWGEALGEREFLCGHIDYVVEAILEVNQHKQSIRGMEAVEAPPFLRHFSARMRQMQEVAGEPQRSAKKTSDLRSDAQGGALCHWL